MDKARAFRSPSRSFGHTKGQGAEEAEPEAPRRHGTCGLCYRHGAELYLIAAGDFIGFACAECRRQLRDSFVRQFCGTAEQTEPEE